MTEDCREISKPSHFSCPSTFFVLVYLLQSRDYHEINLYGLPGFIIYIFNTISVKSTLGLRFSYDIATPYPLNDL